MNVGLSGMFHKQVLWTQIKKYMKTPWIMASISAVVLAIVIGIPVGWALRGKEITGGVPGTNSQERSVSSEYFANSGEYLFTNVNLSCSFRSSLLSYLLMP